MGTSRCRSFLKATPSSTLGVTSSLHLDCVRATSPANKIHDAEQIYGRSKPSLQSSGTGLLMMYVGTFCVLYGFAFLVSNVYILLVSERRFSKCFHSFGLRVDVAAHLQDTSCIVLARARSLELIVSVVQSISRTRDKK